MSKIKKIILVVLITVILIVPFSVSAIESNGAKLSTYDSYIYFDGKYQTYYGSSESGNQIQCNYLGMDTPSDGYLDAVVWLNFNSSQKNGLLQLSFYFIPEGIGTGPADELSSFKNFTGLYNALTGEKLSNGAVSSNKVVVQYKGTIPDKLRIQTKFSCLEADSFQNGIMIVDFVFTPNSELSALENDNANTDKIIDNQDQNTEEIKQAINEQAQTEKQEAQSSGNAAMDSVTSVIPNYAGNLSNYFTALTKRMIHEDMTCFITFPEIKIPAINGFFKETVLSEKKTINMAEVASLIPTKILFLVRYLLTLFLIIYCFKELYSIIQYVMTLKGGNLDE